MSQDSRHLQLATFKTAARSRLQALYSDISRQKASNPAAFHANVDWWRRTLESFVSDGMQANSQDRLVLHASRTLVDALKVDGVGKPLGLSTVVTELLHPAPNASSALPAIVPKASFFSLKHSIYTSSSILSTIPSLIASYLIAKPLWWTLEQMGIVGQDGLFSANDDASRTKWQGDYVVLRLLELAADNIIEAYEDKAATPGDALFTVDMFRKEFAPCLHLPEGAVISRLDTDVLLRHLERDKKVLVVEKDVLKFVSGAEAHASITAVDKGIVELKSAVANMQAQVENLHGRVDSLTQRASEALKQKRKPLAVNHIRQRKQVQELLERRLGALENLESTLLRVEAAAGDIEIMSSYAQSTTTLKTILSHPSLQRDSIDQTLEALADANAEAKDIDEIIRDGAFVASAETFNEADIEAELQGLLLEKEKEDARVLTEKLGTQLPPLPEPLKSMEAVPERSSVAALVTEI